MLQLARSLGGLRAGMRCLLDLTRDPGEDLITLPIPPTRLCVCLSPISARCWVLVGFLFFSQVDGDLERVPGPLEALAGPDDLLLGAALARGALGHDGLVLGDVGDQVAVGHARVEGGARGAGVVAALADGVGRVGARGAAVEGVGVGRGEARCGGEEEEEGGGGGEGLHFGFGFLVGGGVVDGWYIKCVGGGGGSK